MECQVSRITVRKDSAKGLSKIHSFTEATIHQGKEPGRKQLYFSRKSGRRNGKAIGNHAG